MECQQIFNRLRSGKSPALCIKDLSQSFFYHYIDNMTVEESKITFIITEKLKHSRACVHQQPLVFMESSVYCNILIRIFKGYFTYRGDEKQLLVSFVKRLTRLFQLRQSHSG